MNPQLKNPKDLPTTVQSEKAWWNRPIVGNQSITQIVMSIFHKPDVPEDQIFLHNRAFEQVKEIAPLAWAIDNERFGNPEFALFVRISRYLANNVEDYEGLNHSAKLFKVAINTKDSFLSIEQTELRFCSSAQQEFYKSIFQLLEQDITAEYFRDEVRARLAQYVEYVQSEEGKNALYSYSKALDNISEEELGLNLLYKFKRWDLSDFSILRKISDIVDSFRTKELHELKGFKVQVTVNYDLFEQLGEIIELPKKKRQPTNYALLLQYITLMQKHQGAYQQFQQLLGLLKRWEKPFQTVATIREEYKHTEYNQPPDLLKEIPGLNLYLKYKNYLD